MSQEIIETYMSLGNDPQKWIDAFENKMNDTALGVHHCKLISIDDDGAVIEMPIGDHARQPFGLLHGGISMLLAEAVASMHACWEVDLSERVPVGTEINGSHIASASEGTVICRGTVIKRGRTLIRHRVQVFHKESDRLLCEGRVTNLYKSI